MEPIQLPNSSFRLAEVLCINTLCKQLGVLSIKACLSHLHFNESCRVQQIKESVIVDQNPARAVHECVQHMQGFCTKSRLELAATNTARGVRQYGRRRSGMLQSWGVAAVEECDV